MRRVLTDLTGVAQLQIVEGKDGGKLIAEGKIGHCDVPTANGRVYPRSIMEREIKRLQPRIEQASVISAVDHPGDGKTRIKESGAIVRGLWIEDDGEIRGRFEVVEEAPAGQALAAFLRRGAQLGMSSRGMGSTVPGPKGQDIVGEDFKLSTWDFVSDPACRDAYPAIMSEDEEADVTEDHLRARFPEIVQAIEEKAYRTAQEVVEQLVTERVRAEVESEAEEGIKQGREKIREEVREEAYAEAFQTLREDFATRLVRTIAEMRDEITEEVKSDLASDPAVAGAKGTLKKIAEMVNPYTPPPELKQPLQELGSKNDDLQEAVVRLTEQVKQQESRAADLESKGRLLAYKLYIEQSISTHPDADAVRAMIGEVTGAEKVEDLRAKVESALVKANEAREQLQQKVEVAQSEAQNEIALAREEAARIRAEAEQHVRAAEGRAARAERAEKQVEAIIRERTEKLEEQIRSVLAEKDEEIEALRGQLHRAAAHLTEAEETQKRQHLMDYAYRRTVGHPRAREIMEAVAEGNIASKKEIDKICRRLEEAAQEPGGVGERVRRAMSSGREHMTEDERVQHDAEESAMIGEFGEAAADLADLGTSLTEQLNLAGVNRPQRR